MNVLPTSPDGTTSTQQIQQYFTDMKRWNFDVPYTAFYAFPLDQVKGKFKKPYIDFAKYAHDKGYPACVQIQSTVGFLDDVDIENAQYYSDNTTYIYSHFLQYGKKNFFGSFAAPGWLRYIKTITEILRSYGYDWVVFEEPMFRVDIPGTKDKLYERFCQAWPHLPYPTHQEESVSYQRLQELKSLVLEEFYHKLCRFAKEIGYQKCGIMPWFFVPTFENTPMETWNTCCHLGKLTFLPDLDLIVVRMQPDNIYAEATIATSGEAIPQISYLETLSQNLGKPVISVNNPTNEHIRRSANTPNNLLPYDYFARFTLAAAAAVPHGMTRHWYRKDYDHDIKHMALMTNTNRYLPRMGSPSSPLALVFSYIGMNRTIPRPWTETWKSFWFLAHQLLYEHKLPCLTFFAGTLEQSLKQHPETKILIFNEYFPVSTKEAKLVEKWLSSDSSRRILYIGARNGYRRQLDSLYHQFEQKCPEILGIFGCDTDKPVHTVSSGQTVALKSVSDKNAFLGDSQVLMCPAYGFPCITDPSDIEILYTPETSNDPVIFRREIGSGGYALFVGLSTDGLNNTLPLNRIVEFLLHTPQRESSYFPFVKTSSQGIFWNRTFNNFLFLSNCDDTPASYEIPWKNLQMWDLRNEKFLEMPGIYTIPPLDFHVLKILEKNQKLLDIEGQVYLSSVAEDDKTARISGYFSHSIQIKLTSPPSSVRMNEKEMEFKLNQNENCYTIFIDYPEKGDCELVLYFD